MDIMRDSLATVCRAFNQSYGQRTPRLALELPIEEVATALLADDQQRIDDFGGREVDNRVNERVRDELAMKVLEAEEAGVASARIRGVVEDGVFRLDLTLE